VGVGDVGAVPGGTRDPGHTAGGDDGGRADRERERHVLRGRGVHESDSRIEPGGDGVGVVDGARGGSWAGCVHGAWTDGADGMRGDGVGVGDVGVVPGGAWCSGHASNDGDGGRACGQHVGGVLGGCGERELGAALEPSGDRVGVGDGARVELGTGGLDGAGTCRADGMRGDGVGVGDVGAVPGGTWCS